MTCLQSIYYRAQQLLCLHQAACLSCRALCPLHCLAHVCRRSMLYSTMYMYCPCLRSPQGLRTLPKHRIAVSVLQYCCTPSHTADNHPERSSRLRPTIQPYMSLKLEIRFFTALTLGGRFSFVGSHFFPLEYRYQPCFQRQRPAQFTAQLQSVQLQLQLHPQTVLINMHFLLDLSHLHASGVDQRHRC